MNKFGWYYDDGSKQACYVIGHTFHNGKWFIVTNNPVSFDTIISHSSFDVINNNFDNSRMGIKEWGENLYLNLIDIDEFKFRYIVDEDSRLVREDPDKQNNDLYHVKPSNPLYFLGLINSKSTSIIF